MPTRAVSQSSLPFTGSRVVEDVEQQRYTRWWIESSGLSLDELREICGQARLEPPVSELKTEREESRKHARRESISLNASIPRVKSSSDSAPTRAVKTRLERMGSDYRRFYSNESTGVTVYPDGICVTVRGDDELQRRRTQSCSGDAPARAAGSERNVLEALQYE